ncbi:MAG: hypothetical protein RDU25_02345 [Patescibacteria group bacterium]|nr:hypothetical protein [Patescibacteria group bacterium]
MKPLQADNRRVKYIKAKCLATYGLEQPLHWLKGQKVSEVPDFDTWKRLLDKFTACMEETPWAHFLHTYGAFPPEEWLTGWRGVGHLLATLLDPTKVEIFEAEVGEPTYYVVPRSYPDTLFLLRSDGYFDRIALGKPTLEPKYVGPLLEAAVLRAWNTEGAPLRLEARKLVCDAFYDSIQRQVESWEVEYNRSTVACTVFQDQFHWGPGVLRTDKVVIWQVVQGKIVAELFSGDKFTPESFHDDAVQRIPMLNHTADSLLYGHERRFLFRRRSLEFMLQKFHRDVTTLCVVPVSADGEIPREFILVASRSSLKHPNPTDGEPLLCPSI